MKKVFSFILALTFGLFLFTGCTHSAGTTVTGIAFTQEVFYLDLNVPTRLTYKVYPSSAPYNAPQITFDKTSELDMSIGRISNDTFVISDHNFKETTFHIAYSTGSGTQYKDDCIVRLKKYPSQVYVEDKNALLDGNQAYISSKGILQIPLIGLFDDGEKAMDTSYYKFVVTSSDSTVISVESQQNIVVKSTGKQGKSTINIKVVASDGSKIGEDGLVTSVDVFVNNNVDNCSLFTTYTGTDAKINSSFYRDLKNTNTKLVFDSTVENYTYTIEPVLLDREGYVVSNVGYQIISMDEDIIEIIDNKNGTYSLKAKSSGETEILITSNGYGADGSAVIFKIVCESFISS